MTRTRAIVFDMDGVLIDSEELHAHAKRIAFAHAGIALTQADLRAYARKRAEPVLSKSRTADHHGRTVCCRCGMTSFDASASGFTPTKKRTR
jgi:beta-phosphoglucomutase-like phosphatase (HAD superfamily)